MINKKIILTVAFTIIIFGVGMSISQNISTQKKYSDVFFLDGMFYPDKKQVIITFSDKTKKSTSVVLEILGMETSFQKILNGPNFTLAVPFDSEPEYGWKVTPITLVVDHPEFGKIGIKTNIHNKGESSPVIFTDL